MFFSLQVLCLLAFAAIRTTCFECGINVTGYSAELTPASVHVPSGSSVTLTCRTTPLVTFPQWHIDDEAFTADRLPVDFTANESSIRFAAEDDVEIFCFFRLILGGSVVNICSKPSSIAVDGPRAPTDYASCNDVKVSFFSNADDMLTIYIDGVRRNTDDCKVSVLLTDCADSENRAEMSEPVNAENGLATITTNIGKFSEKSISVDVSAESCDLLCEPPHNYYFTAIKPTGKRHIPNGSYNGTLIADAFSEAAIDCNFRGNVLEYTICVQSGGSIDCFDNPCLSDKVFPAKCFGSSSNAIEVDKAGNGTIVSIFCPKRNCGDLYYSSVAFNFVILTCDENAEFKGGECICNGNYTGDGITCTPTASENGRINHGSTIGSHVIVVLFGFSLSLWAIGL